MVFIKPIGKYNINVMKAFGNYQRAHPTCHLLLGGRPAILGEMAAKEKLSRTGLAIRIQIAVFQEHAQPQ